ncbi:MAG: response regulator [Gaiellaceae bacterium]
MGIAMPKRAATRVLVVDDDPAIRMLCSVNLQLEGLVVLEATDGRHGLEQARSHRPDLVLTDVMMPGLDGFQFAEALRGDERTRRVPLIFLSGETDAAHEIRARELGALGYLTKPFDPAALASMIAGVLGRAATADATQTAARRHQGVGDASGTEPTAAAAGD